MKIDTKNRTQTCAHLIRTCVADKSKIVVELVTHHDPNKERVPIPLQTVVLLSLLSSGEKETDITPIENILRELYLPELTTAQCCALLQYAENLEDIVAAARRTTTVTIYPNGDIYVVAPGYYLRRIESGWTVHFTEGGESLQPTSLSQALELAKFVRGVVDPTVASANTDDTH